VELNLWPASPVAPRIAFTFEFMRTLKAIVLEGQISLLAFASALQNSRSHQFSRDLVSIIQVMVDGRVTCLSE
jgi:hypothetical protein